MKAGEQGKFQDVLRIKSEVDTVSPKKKSPERCKNTWLGFILCENTHGLLSMTCDTWTKGRNGRRKRKTMLTRIILGDKRESELACTVLLRYSILVASCLLRVPLSSHALML